MNDLPYFIAIGAWGDTLSYYAVICSKMKTMGITKANILHYGFDPKIKDFLEYQDNIEKAINVIPTSVEAYEKIIQIASFGVNKWVEIIFGIPAEKVILVIDFNVMVNEKIVRHFDYKIPSNEISVPPNSILFNPYSFQSCTYKEHCSFTNAILAFLVEETDHPVVLVGLEKTFNIIYGWWDFPMQVDHPQVINLVGKTKSMMEVLSLSQDCVGIISTSGCLAAWSIITNTPAIILMNSRLTNPSSSIGLEYWKAWHEHEPNQCVYFDQTIDDFKNVFENCPMDLIG